MIDFEPNDEQAMIIETVRQFASQEIRPRARECEETKTLPDELLREAHELGLVANGLPEEFGGGGEASAVTGCLIAEELAWGDLAIAIAILSPSLLGVALSRFGTEEQKQRFLPGLVGPAFAPGALAVSEPRFDSDPLRPQTRARRDGSDYVLTGEKCQVPWLDAGRAVLAFAEEDGAAQGFLLPREGDGLEIEIEHNMGLGALPSASLRLDGIRVDASARLGGERGADIRELVQRGRVGLAALAIGMARAAFETARDYAKEREAFGAPIATRQAIAFKLADMATAIDGARLLTWEAAWTLDQGRDAARTSALAHAQACRSVLGVADDAVQIFGGHGFIRDYLPELWLRNAAGFPGGFEALTLV